MLTIDGSGVNGAYGFDSGDGYGIGYGIGYGFGCGHYYGNGYGDGNGRSGVNDAGSGWGDGVQGHGDGDGHGSGLKRNYFDNHHFTTLIINTDPLTMAYQTVTMQAHKEYHA